MRINLITALYLLSLFVGCSAKTPTPEEMIAAAKMLDNKLVDSLNKLDIAGFMDLRWNDPKLIILDEDEIIVGSETYAKGMAAWFKKFKSMKGAYIEATNVSDGMLVFGHQKWSIEGVLNDGNIRKANGIHSDVKAMRDGKLVIVSETWVKLPPTADEQLKQVDGLEKRTAQAYENRNLNAYLANFWANPALVVLDVGHIFVGGDNWKSEMTGQMQKIKPGAKFEETEIHNISLGSAVLGYGRWQYTPAPGAKTFEGVYSNVKAFKDGKWVIVMDHYSEAAHPSKAPNLPRKK